MTSGAWNWQEVEQSENKIKRFFDYFEQKSANNELSSNACGILVDLEDDVQHAPQKDKSTNPFISSSIFDNELPDPRSFFDNLLDREEDLITFGETSPPKNTNPFLDNADNKRVSDTGACVANVSDFINENTSGHNVELDDCQGDPYNRFINESSFDDRNECEIVNYFDKKRWKQGDFFPLRVSNIYHPNKFWIVARYKELEIFMQYLHEFYSKNKNSLRLKNPSVNLYCVVSHNSLFYRAIIVKLLPNDPYRVKVFLFDYGIILVVYKEEIYYLREKLYNIPQFAMRASLAYVAPKRTQVWTSEAVKAFDEVASRRILIAEIVHVDETSKCLEVNLGDMPSGGTDVAYINDMLINENYARYNFDNREPDVVHFNTKMKHLYVFPTFQMLESGSVPSSVYQFEALMNNRAAFDILYGKYCTLK